jgi:hypothetical protein
LESCNEVDLLANKVVVVTLSPSGCMGQKRQC